MESIQTRVVGTDPNAQLFATVQNRGVTIDVACTTQAGRATRRAARFAIPLFHVRDVPGEEFERQLEGWLTGQG